MSFVDEKINLFFKSTINNPIICNHKHISYIISSSRNNLFKIKKYVYTVYMKY